METLGKRLQRLRAARGLTLRQVSEAVGVPLSTYREWENGRSIQGEPYHLLAEIFDIGLHELMTGKKIEKAEALHVLARIEQQIAELRQILRS